MKETRTVEELTNGWDSSSEIHLDEDGVFELPIDVRLLKYRSELPKGVEYVCCMQNTFGHPFDLYSNGDDDFYGVVPWTEDLDMEHNLNKAKEPVDIFNDDINGELKYKCPTCGYEFNKAPRCPECGQLVKEKENKKMEIIREIKCECYDDFMTQWFEITKDMLNSTSRAELIGMLVGEDTGVANKFYVTIQEDGWARFTVIDNDKVMESLYECEFFSDPTFCTYPIIREIKVPERGWKKDEDGDEYYVSPRTGWVYCFYKLQTFNDKYPNTDRVCCMHEYTNEIEMLEPGAERYEVEKIVGWEYTSMEDTIPKQDFEEMINRYEERKRGN